MVLEITGTKILLQNNKYNSLDKQARTAGHEMLILKVKDPQKTILYHPLYKKLIKEQKV